MPDSNNPPIKCFSGILRRLLCTGSLPTHPSEEATTAEKAAQTQLFEKKAAHTLETQPGEVSPVAPGIVARLMGLESMPEDLQRWKAGALPESKLGRSRSMSSLEYLIRFERLRGNTNRTASFREAPTSLRAQDQDFVDLCFGDPEEETEVNGRKAVESKERKPKTGDGKANKVCCNCKGRTENLKGNRETPTRNRQISEAKRPSKPAVKKEISNRSKIAKKKRSERGFRKVGPESNSPNSDSDDVVSPTQPEQSPSSEDESSTKATKKKSPPREPRSKHPIRRNEAFSAMDDHEAKGMLENRDADVGINRTGSETENYLEMLDNICTLTEADVKKSNWGDGVIPGAEDQQHICMDLGERILEQMTCLVVDDLFAISSRNGIVVNLL